MSVVAVCRIVVYASRDANRALGAVVEDSADSSSLVDASNGLREIWDRARSPETEVIVRRSSCMETIVFDRHHDQAGMFFTLNRSNRDGP
jgi:hypothetical protein